MRRRRSCSTTRSSSPPALKGKAEPVRVFHAKAPRARFGTDLTRTHDSPFVGREIDLAMLKGVFDKTVAASSVQLVTVVGEPGLGKSRIVAELGVYVDARPDLVTWRQGRCLPYGEGITFWALGEIVKAHAGILESDPPEVARASWIRCCRKGRSASGSGSGCCRCSGSRRHRRREREELFTAWRRFLEHVADERPTVLVFEDLHWADERDARVPRAPGRPRRRRAAAARRHRPARALRAPSRLRQRGCATRLRSTWPRCRRRRPPDSSRRSWTRPCCRPSCSSRSSSGPAATRSTPRSSSGCCKDRDLLVRAGTELGAEGGRGGAVPGLGAGTDRRPPRHARRRRRSRCSPTRR